MLTFWRICAARRAATAFDGEGARLYGGRWNGKGVALVYGSSSLSLATLELYVHFDPLTAPAAYVSFRASLPDGLAERVEASKLSKRWRDYPAPSELQDIGGEWASSLRTVALLVPSAVTPIEDNVLLNPRHPAFAKLEIGPRQVFAFDPRMHK